MFLPKVMQEDKWLRLRERGIMSFITLHGILKWGITTAALWSGAMTVLVSDSNTARDVPRAFMIFPAVGILWGAATWWMNERFYKNTIK